MAEAVKGEDAPGNEEFFDAYSDVKALNDKNEEGASSCEEKTTDDKESDKEEVSEEVKRKSEEERKEEKERQEKERIEKESQLSEEERTKRKEDALELKKEGNRKFGEGFWQDAVDVYTKALDLCPMVYTSDRSMLLSNRAACYIKLNDFETAALDCTEAIEIGAVNEKPLERRAHCYANKEDTYDKALDDYAELIKTFPDRRAYREQHGKMERLIQERNEKLKEDMLEKLKSLGNMCLRPFGLSTDNFEMVPQPGGGYSINMKK